MWQIWFWDYKNVYTLGSMYALIQQNIYSQCLATWKKTCISKLSKLKGPRNKQVHFWLKVYKLWTKKYVFKNLLMWFIDVNFSHSWSLAFGPFHAKTQNRSEMRYWAQSNYSTSLVEECGGYWQNAHVSILYLRIHNQE